MTPSRITLAGLVVALSCSIACQANKTSALLSGGSTPGAAEVGQKTAKTLGAGGGQVSTPGKTASISLPAGSLSGSTPVTLVVKDANSVPQTAPVLSNVYDFGPSGTNFSQAATLAIKVSTPPAAGQNPVLAYLDANNTWQVLLGSSYDASSGTVTAATTHFTLFSIITMAADGTGCAGQGDPQAYCAEQNLICDLTLNRCATPDFGVGGAVTGLQGTLTLTNNGNDTATVAADGTFQFAGTYADASDFNVVIAAQPPGQTCTFVTTAAGIGLPTGTIETASVSLAINCLNNFSVGGTVVGLEDGGSLTLANGNDVVTLTDNVAFTFATPVPDGQNYNALLVSEPNDQTCIIAGGFGAPQGANVTINVACAYNPVPLTTTVTGLVDGTVLTLGNGNDVIAAGTAAAIAGGNTFVVSEGQVGDAYAISVLAQPDGQTCTITQWGSGTVEPGDPNAAIINCVPNNYNIGGTVNGLLAGNTVGISLGSETITLDNTSSGFNFTTPVTFNTPYQVNVSQQPVGQVCLFSGGVSGGNMVGENITNLQLTCLVNAYAVGGTVSGLPADGTAVTLTINTGAAANAAGPLAAGAALNTTAAASAAGGFTAAGGIATTVGVETIPLSNGDFNFTTRVSYQQAFTVSFFNPPGQVCNIWGNANNFTQVMPAQDFNGINVSCQPLSFSVSGSVSGLLRNAFVTLQNGPDSVTVANGLFTFPTSVASGANYNVTIASPAGHRCDFGSGTRGAGTMGGQPIGNIAVRCGPAPYFLGGTVTGLAADANVVIQGDMDLIFAANGTYELPTPYPYDSNYAVSVVSPLHQVCGFVNSPNALLAQGVIPAADMTSLNIYCSPPTYQLGGPVVGLVANTNVQLQNGADTISVSNGTYVFPTALAVSAGYNVSITSPTAQTCAFAAGVSGSGIVGTTDITGVAVVCAPQTFQLAGTVSGLQNNTRVTLRNGTDVVTPANGPYSFPTGIAFGAAYGAQVTAPAGQTCQFVSAGAPAAGAMPNQNVTTLNVACGSIFYTLGGQVSGLAVNTRVALRDGVDNITAANGTYTFPTQLVSGVGYNVTLTSPAGQACTFSGSSTGTISSNVSSINVLCAPIPYTLSGTVSNLLNSTQVTVNNGADSIQASNGPFALPTALNANAPYNVSLVSPAGQTCSFNVNGNASVTGQIQNANVATLDISCLVNQYFIGGTVSGLSRKNSVSIRNGLDQVFAVNGNFQLPTPIFLNGTYALTLYTYGNQVCSFGNGNAGLSGAISVNGLTNVRVSCAAPSYSLGGVVAGLVPGTTVTLTNGVDTINVPAGPYTFPTLVAAGGNYQISVSPGTAQTCTVTGGTGVMGTTGVVTANVACVSQTFALGGTVSGLVNNANLFVQNGSDAIAVQNGSFTFPTAVAYGAPYGVNIKAPPGQICQVTSAGAPPQGIMQATAVNNITVVCSASSYTLGGNISGLGPVGSVKLQNGNDTVVAANGPYTFPTTLITGVDYNVTLISPPGQSCAFTADASPAGTIVASSINNINVSCLTNSYSIGGKVANLVAGSTVQLTNGTDTLVSGNGPFTFPTPLPISASYSAGLISPPGQTCGFAGSGNSISGIVGNGNVYSLYVLCTTNLYPIGVTVSGLMGNNNLLVQNGVDAVPMQNGNITLPTRVPYGAPYNVIFVQPVNQVCSFARTGPPSAGIAYAATSLSIACSTPSFPIGGYVTGLPSTVAVTVRNGNDAITVANGPYSMPTPVAWGANYAVTLTVPNGYQCSFVTAGSDQGAINGAAVTNINIGCQVQMQTLGGHVSGLVPNANIFLSDASDLIAVGNGAYTLPTPLGFSSQYQLSASSPPGQTCNFASSVLSANGNTVTGRLGNSNITNLDVTCSLNTYAISGYVQGLTNGTQVTVSNGNDVLNVANGQFQLPTPVSYTANYGISLGSPNGQLCQIAGNANGGVVQGVMQAAPLTSLLIRCAPVTYTVGGSISGAVAGSQISLSNGQDSISVVATGSAPQPFTMPMAVVAGGSYSLAIAPSSSQSCVLAAGVAASGVVNGNLTNLNVQCTPNAFHIGGTVAGLVGGGNVTLSNGADRLALGNGNYTFPTPVAYGAPFFPAIVSPQFQTCQFVNQGLPVNGNMMGRDYTNLNVVCGGNTVTVGGIVSGLLPNTTVTLFNGNDRLAVGNGNYTFPSPVLSGAPYGVVVGAASGQLCFLANPNVGVGTAGNTAVANVNVACSAQRYQLSGNLTRTLGNSNITLSNGSDQISMRNSGTFTFPTPVLFGGNYAVSFFDPPGELCRFSASPAGDANVKFAGTMPAGNVNNVNLTCVTNTYPLYVNVSGLLPGTQLTVRNGNDVVSNANGRVLLPTLVAYASPYNVTLSTTGLQTCAVAANSPSLQGNMSIGATSLGVQCTTPLFTIGGTVAGLAPNTSVTLQNGNDSVQTSGTYTFPTPVSAGAKFSASIVQPVGQMCNFAAGATSSGVLTASLPNLNVSCYPQVYPVSVAVSGLTGNNNVTVQNGNDVASVGNGSYIFPTPVAFGAAVLTSVVSPSTQSCSFAAGSAQVQATMSTQFAPLTIVCRNNPYTIGGTVRGLLANTTVQLQNGNQTVSASNGNFTFPGTVFAGTAYSVTASPVPGQLCSFSNANSVRGIVNGPVSNITLNCVAASYALSGNVYNLLPNTAVTLSDNVDQISASNGSFVFPTLIGANLPYNVSAYPLNGQSCVFQPGNANAGVMTATTQSLTVKCSLNTYPLSGSVSGLTGNANLVARSGNDIIRLSNGTFAMPTAIAYNAPYAVTLINSGPQVCSFSGTGGLTVASGVMPAGPVQTLTVYCYTPSYSVGGTVTGLVGTAPLQLQNNGDAVAVFGGNFTFPRGVPAGSNYNVTITQPPGQTCSFTIATGGQGVVNGNTTGVNIGCSPQLFALGGTVSGLSASAQVTLQNGNDTLVVGNGNYTFPTKVAFSAPYNAQVTSPNLTTCQFSANGTLARGQMPGPVGSLNVVCGTNSYPVGGTVSGLSPNTLVTLRNGSDSVTVGNGTYSFPTSVIAGAGYSVMIASPAGQQCTFTGSAGGQGVVQGPVSNVAVACAPGMYSLSGTVNNLSPNTTVTITNGNDRVVAANGSFALPTALLGNANYNLQVQSPPGQSCAVSYSASATANTAGTAGATNAGSLVALPGAMMNANVVVSVGCSVNYYSLGGYVQGLVTSSTIVLKTTTDTLSQNGPGTFTFPTVLPYGAPYTVSVRSTSNQICTFSDSASSVLQGVMPANPVQNLAVQCYTPSYTVGGAVSGLPPNTSVTLVDNGYDTVTAGNGNYTFPSPLSGGSSYNVALTTAPPGQSCMLPATVSAGGPINGNITNVNVGCQTNYYPLGGSVSGLAANVAVTLRNGNDRIVAGNGNFTFPTPLVFGANYNVTVTSPATQTCLIGGTAAGAMPPFGVNTLNVFCGPLQGNFTISGYVSNLMANANVALSDGIDTITVGNGPFTFPSYVAGSTNYMVNVVNPVGQSCTFAANANQVSGVVNGNITGLGVQCTPNYYSLGGYVSGGFSGGNVTIRNGSDVISVGQGPFTLPTLLTYNAPYSVRVSTTVPYLQCGFYVPGGGTANTANGTTGGAGNSNAIQGVMPPYAMQSLMVMCNLPYYPVSGTVSGLVNNTSVQVVNNGFDTITSFGGNFTFQSYVQAGQNYNVNVISPPGETCSVAGASTGNVTTGPVNVNVGCVPQRFVLGGSVSGLNANNLVTLVNGNDRLTVGNGNYSFPTPVAYGLGYNANVISPNYQTCQFSGLAGAGIMPPGDVSQLSVQCGSQQGNFTVAGNVSGLGPNANVTITRGNDSVTVGNGSYQLPTQLSGGSAFAVFVSSPPGLSCNFAGSGNSISGIASSIVNNLPIQCSLAAYTLGGIVSPGGLPQGANVIIHNGNDTLTTGSGQFTLPTPVAFNANYAVSVSSSIPFLNCTFAGANNGNVFAGVMPSNPIQSMYIMCNMASFGVGGTVTGLLPNSNLSIYNNGFDGITSYGGNFTFPTFVQGGGNYNVTLGQVQGQTCTLAQGVPAVGQVTGTISNLLINCVPQRFTLGGSITGVNPDSTLTLSNGNDRILVSNGNYTFPTPVAYNASYSATFTVPNNQTCQFTSMPGSGIMPSLPIGNLNIGCAAVQGNFQISGNVNNLVGSTMVQVYDGYEWIAAGNGPFVFPTALHTGSNYNVTIANPPGQSCSLLGNANVLAGTISGPVSGIGINCVPGAFTLGGTVSAGQSTGAQNANVIIRNGNDVVSLLSGPFNLPTPVTYNAPVNLVVSSANPYASCFVSLTNGQSAQNSNLIANNNVLSGPMPGYALQTINASCYIPLFQVGGTVSGLNSNTPLRLTNNGNDTVVVGNGQFTFANLVNAGGNYLVALTQPTGQTCSIANNTARGTVTTGNVGNIAISCVPQTYTLGGQISGLAGGGNVTLRNGNDVVSMSNGNYTFATAVAWGSNYSVGLTVPQGQVCQISPAAPAGVMPAGPITNLNVVCGTSTYTVGGQVTGLLANTNVMLGNGNDLISVANGGFTFPTGVVPGGTYNVRVLSPANQGCAFVNPNQSFGAPTANMTNLAIACVQGNFIIRGTASGLVVNSNVYLYDGVDVLTAGNGAFAFPTALGAGTNYAVSIQSSPGQTCGFGANGNVVTGVITGNVTTLALQCVPNSYSITGQISPGGFPQGANVTIRNGNDVLTVGAVAFTLPTPLVYNAAYSVSVTSSYPYLSCSVQGANGTIQGNMPPNNLFLYVQCSVPTYQVGGSVSGLTGGSTVAIYDNGADGIQVGNGNFSFPTWVLAGGNYSASVGQQPAGQTCSVQGSGSGRVTGIINGIRIACVPQQYTISGFITGLTNNGRVGIINGNDTIAVGNGNYTLPTPVVYGGNYSVSLVSPQGQTCQVGGFPQAGTMPLQGISQLNISCALTGGNYTVSGTVSGLQQNTNVILSDGFDTIVAVNGAFNFPTQLANGSNFYVQVSYAQGQTCAVNGNSGYSGQVSGPVTGISVVCQVQTFPLAGFATISGGNVTLTNGNDVLSVGQGSFTFPTQLAVNAPYSVSVTSPNPYAQCNISGPNGSNGNMVTGTMPPSEADFYVSCHVPAYQVSVNVNNLDPNTVLTLVDNGNDTANGYSGAYYFQNQVQAGGNYNITWQQPTGQTCAFTPGNSATGTVTNGPINLNMNCMIASYPVSGTVSGLPNNTNATLMLTSSNYPSQSVTVVNGNYTFSNPMPWTAPYVLGINKPSGVNCQYVPTNAGFMPPGPLARNVVCSTNLYTLSGTVTGLAGGANVTIKNLANSASQASTGNGNFALSYGTVPGGNYNIVLVSPPNQGCALVNPALAAGFPQGNVTNLAVNCVQGNFTIGGSVAGLIANTNILLTDGVDTPSLGNGAFTFPTRQVAGTQYAVSILSAPGHNCVFTANNSNVVGGTLVSNLSNLAIQCAPASYIVGGVVSPGNFPAGATVTIHNGNDTITTGTGNFALPTPVVFNANYAVTVSSSYPYLSCNVGGNSNTVQGLMMPYNLSLYVMCSVPQFPVGGTVTGLTNGAGVSIYNNGTDGIYQSSDGSFQFPMPVKAGGNFSVSIGQTQGTNCAVAPGTPVSGIVTGYINNISILCGAALSQTVLGGTVFGLIGPPVALYDGTEVTYAGNGSYAFPTPLNNNAGNYFAQLQNPPGQTCVFPTTNSNMVHGTLGNGPPQLDIHCSTNSYPVGGYAGGAPPNSNIIIMSGNDVIRIGSGAFTLPTPVEFNQTFSVAVGSDNPYVSCNVSDYTNQLGANGNVLTGALWQPYPLNSIYVSCYAPQYSVSGGVNGLNPNSSLTLYNNGTDTVTASSQNGNFYYFQNLITAGGNYALSYAQPPGQICNPVQGPLTGTVTYTNVNLDINCVNQSYSLGGRISGLTSNTNVTVRNGNDVLVVTNGNYQLPTRVMFGGNYNATLTAPSGQTCQFSPLPGRGVMGGGSISNLNVVCGTGTFTVAGRVTGLLANTNITLNNGPDTVSVTNGNFVFPTHMVAGTTYNIGIGNPVNQGCAFTNPNASTGVVTANVSNLAIACLQGNFTISGTVNHFVSGSGGNIMLTDGLDYFQVGNGAFTFPTPLPAGSNYNITVGVTGQTCTVNGNINGLVGTLMSNMNSVNITCSPNAYRIGGMVSPGGIPPGASVILSDGIDTITATSGQFSFPTPLVYNTNYTVSVLGNSVAGMSCNLAGGQNVLQGTVPGYAMNNLYVMCQVGSYNIGGNILNLPQGASVTVSDKIDTIQVSYSGIYTFPTVFRAGANYQVYLSLGQPGCRFVNPGMTGGIVAGPVTNLDIDCSGMGNANSTNPNGSGGGNGGSNSGSYLVGGVISGLVQNTYLALVNDSNYVYDFTEVGNGPYEFNTRIPVGSDYNVLAVSVVGQTCLPSGATPVGTINGNDALNINFNCNVSLFMDSSGEAASAEYGQPDFNTTTFAGATGASFNAPVGRAFDLVPGNSLLLLPDAGDYRALLFNGIPNPGGSANDVIGQTSLNANVPVTRANATAGTMAPSDIFGDANNLVMADPTNNRVLLWSGGMRPIQGTNHAAQLVVGQTTLAGGSNASACTATGLNAPQSAATAQGVLAVTDTSNHRVLVYHQYPTANGAAADVVLGQSSFTSCTSNKGTAVSAASLSAPSSVWTDGVALLVADTNNNRVLFWQRIPTASGAPADGVLGQSGFTSATAGTSAITLNGPTSIYADSWAMYVADTNNNRVMQYQLGGATPTPIAVLGQPNMTSNTCNGGGASASTLCRPRGVSISGTALVVTDTGNNRFMLYQSY